MLNITTFLVKPKVDKPAGWAVFADYMVSKNPLVWYRFNEESGTTLIDYSGNGNHGAYEGSVALGQPGLVTGDSDTAVELEADEYLDSVYLSCKFDSITDDSKNGHTITLNSSAEINSDNQLFGLDTLNSNGSGIITTGTTLTGDFTLEAHVYLQSLASYQGIFSFGNESTGRIAFQLNNGKLDYDIYAGGLEPNIGSTVLSTGQWYHICFQRVGSTVTGYIDGADNGSQPIPGTIGNANALSLGASLNGYLANVRITLGQARYQGDFIPPTKQYSVEDGKVNLSDISTFKNAGALGYDMRHAFKPTNNYGAGTAREVLLDMHDDTNGVLVEYGTGKLKYTHGSETKSIAVTFDSGSIYRLVFNYSASTKLLEVYSNDTLLDSHTFTNALVMPDYYNEGYSSLAISGITTEQNFTALLTTSTGRLIGGSSNPSNGDGNVFYSDNGTSFTKVSTTMRELWAIFEDSNNRIWIAGSNTSGAVIQYSDNDGASFSAPVSLGATILGAIYSVIETPGSRLYFACDSGGGVGSADLFYSTDYSAGSPTFPAVNKVDVSATANRAQGLFIDKDNRMWVCTGTATGDGDIHFCDNYDTATPTVTKVELGATIERANCVGQFAEGRLMVGTGITTGDGDVYFCDNATSATPTFSKAEIGSNIGRVNAILVDSSNVAYIGTGSGSGDGIILASKTGDDGDWQEIIVDDTDTITNVWAIQEAFNKLCVGTGTTTAQIWSSDKIKYISRGNLTIDEFSYNEGPTTAEDIAIDYSYFDI